MLKQILSGCTLALMVAASLPQVNAAEARLASKTSNEREVKVTVTPRNISKEATTWEFEVTLETHTRPLGDDPAKISTLIVEGTKYAPLRWEGAPPGGHHRKGVLHFKAVKPQPHAVELQIRLAGDAAPRNFQWSLNGAGSGK